MMKDSESTEELKEALDIFKEVETILPEVPALYYNQAVIYQTLRNWENALKRIEEALQLDPNNIKYLKLKFSCLQHLDMVNKAIETAEIIQQLSYDPDMMINVGFLYLKQDNLEQATQTFEQLLHEGSNEGIVYFTLGILKYQGNELSEAEQLIREALSQEYQTDQSIQILAAIYDRQDEVRRAIELLQDQQDLSDSNLYMLARMYKRNAQYIRAESTIDVLLTKEKSPKYLNFKANVLRESENYQEAINVYDQVLEQEGENLTAIKGKALSLVELGKHDEANELFEKGERINRGEDETPKFDNFIQGLDVIN